jgi:hypothetical protein
LIAKNLRSGDGPESKWCIAMAESRRLLKVLFWLCGIALPVCSQTDGQEPFSGGDSHEISRPDSRYLFGD